VIPLPAVLLAIPVTLALANLIAAARPAGPPRAPSPRPRPAHRV